MKIIKILFVTIITSVFLNAEYFNHDTHYGYRTHKVYKEQDRRYYYPRYNTNYYNERGFYKRKPHRRSDRVISKRIIKEDMYGNSFYFEEISYKQRKPYQKLKKHRRKSEFRYGDGISLFWLLEDEF